MNSLSLTSFSMNLIIALLFGATFWAFLEFIQPAIVNQIYNCSFCDRCANILYDKEQPVLALCAGLSFVILSLLTVKGWKGVLKIIGISYLCFQLYSLKTMWSVVSSEECTALHRERAIPLIALFVLIISMSITSGIWSAICSFALMIYYGILAVVFAGKDDHQSLNLEV